MRRLLFITASLDFHSILVGLIQGVALAWEIKLPPASVFVLVYISESSANAPYECDIPEFTHLYFTLLLAY